MRLKELRIKNFGKLSDKTISLDDGINVIYGENESGKSTIHTFIRGMFFGMERARGRAAQKSAFAKYEPWENPNYYSGELDFEVDDKRFVLSRNFDKYHKDVSLICLDDGEELSVEHGDLEMLMDGLSGQTYDNTFSIAQLSARPGVSLAEELKNYAMNYYASGDSELKLNVAIDKLKSRDKEIRKLSEEYTEKKQSQREHISQEMSYIWRDIHKLTQEKEELQKELEERREHDKRKEQDMQKHDVEKHHKIDEIRPVGWRVHPIEIIACLLLISATFIFLPQPFNYLLAIVLTLLSVIYIWNRMKISKKVEKTEPEIILEEITPAEDRLSAERLQWEIQHREEVLGERQVQYNNLSESLEDLDEVSDEAKTLDDRRTAIRLAIEKITELSGELQKGLRLKLNQVTSEIVSEITQGKYTRLIVEENLSMTVMEGNRKINVDQVSQGTAEQIYFALRMAAIEILHEDDYPILLDDTFVNYDDKRLEGVLAWLAKSGRQVLLFTCQKREQELLEHMNADYHYFKMS